MLANTGDLCFVYLEPFEGHYQFFRLKSRFLNFCERFIPNFEKLHYLLHLNELEDDAVSNDSSVKIGDVNTTFLGTKLNLKDNAAKC